ncbi:prolyl oligopeptidase family serine peptidase [Alloacidobacterium sp.]|uniref:prolyl oligopeptidase family serine peptidase n=1 Tax=Alloacidobacterium sp. TaxID=2951999 RepID=UPI002D623FA3|nr:prolyl oligopeptidase family serine peptidase [Alloacidobacterium sp.]HYK35377.1 prolyl oligopeptidase family serine peptidase [Alloacidobacterium sp.]
MRIVRTSALCLIALLCSSYGFSGKTIEGRNGISLPEPPPTATDTVVDNLHGVEIADPYRWLEDAKSPQTRAWIDLQIKYTDDYLSQIKNRSQIVDGLTKLQRVDVYSVPREYGGRIFFEKRLADENQSSIYMREGWTSADIRLVDATKLSADQNTSVTINDISSDGKMLVYGVRQGGADEESVHILNVDTRQDLSDSLPSARYFGVALSPDKEGIYYARFTHEGTTIHYHKLGTPIADDPMLFGKEYRGEKLGELELISVGVTDNGRYLMIRISRGVPATREDILVKDLRKPDSEIVPLVYGIEARTSAVNIGDRFFLSTDYNAANKRIVEAKPGESPEQWKIVISEGKDVIDGFNIVGGKLFVRRLHDVKTETSIYSLDGKQIGQITYPGIGSGTDLIGRPEQKTGFYVFQSFILPPTIYRYDTKTGKSDIFFQPKVPFDTSQYEIKQVFYTSKDGTRVPMFIAGKKGLKQDGSAHLLMTGYGGFEIPMLAAWNPEYAWWMEQGGYFAQPNLRGGDEYGEAWHKAAMFEKKQNVFDDWFSAAEYLIQNHYTTPERFAIRGRSNGGLLMGASITQRPDLFGAIWCGYPLLDMLRYQDFLIGRFWTTEYGDADNARDFPYLLKYSPYQNVKPGTKYPAIMFFTGDSDTRVDPLHARKMTARVQAANGGDRPILLHYSLKGGHSSGVSLTQLVDDEADELAFLWNETSAP